MANINHKTDPTGWNLDNSYIRLPKSFYSKLKPTPVHSPKLVILNRKLASDLGLNADELQKNDGVSILAGNRVPQGTEPIAQAYAGHQFGFFTLLGDGRAILLGEQITPQGERFDIQWKGSGRTPYSRGGDGRAALGPMLREYIISEGMHGLGIDTTRSLAVVATGEQVIRETLLPGAVLTRVARSHIRVGTFQCFSKWGTTEDFKMLADYTIKRHFPGCVHENNRYLALLKETVKRQAALIAKWQLAGFVHGVMNTDNMAVSGETIDYGPCAFMDTFNPDTVFSSIDLQGRYAYGNQPEIAAWNLARFADTLIPLLDSDRPRAVDLAQEAILEFYPLYQKCWLSGMRKKLGLFDEEKQDENLIEDLLTLMHTHQADYTNTFLALTFDNREKTSLFESLPFAKWHQTWQARLDRQKEQRASSYQLMKNSNPALIPRNHRVEDALEAAVKSEDYSVMEHFLSALSKPYAHTEQQARYASLPSSSACSYRTFCGT